ncbi:hypothetical protein V3O24_14660 [Methylobacter sp. Wu8]|uniref:hypothetical protein n=1 Tax=Methylobacter sp. Wu8 TaxID=3118457 RepID=UPI002F327678
MINITIDNPDIEQILQQTYGNNHSRLIKEFSQFIQAAKIKDDIGISIHQLEQGESVKLADTFTQIKRKYEE